MKQENGWISPRGSFYPTGTAGGHAIVARELGSNDRTLEALGWLHLSGEELYYYIGTPVTDAQRRTLKNIIDMDPTSKLSSNLADFLEHPDNWYMPRPRRL